MPPRLRSKPYGPNSPNAAEGLPDPAPRRRRATRSASAQPQEDQSAPPVREPKTRKTRGKAASRGRKKATTRTSHSPSPPPSATLQPNQLEGDDITSSAAAHAPNEKVESPDVQLATILEHKEPTEATVEEPAVDQVPEDDLLDRPLADLSLADPVLSEGQKADQSAAEQIQAELEMHIPASPSVEIPVTVLPSIESSDPEIPTPIIGESPPFFSLRSSRRSLHSSSVPWFSVRSSSVVSAASTASDIPSSTTSTSTEVPGNQSRSWLMTQLRSLYHLCTRSQGASIPPAATITVGWSQDIPVLDPNTVQSHSALDDVELISIIRAVRSGRQSNRRRSRASPSTSVSEQSRVLRAQEATPIHRSRTSYANRSNSRRIESRGSLGRTLYRLPQLLSFHSEPEVQDGSGEGTIPAHEQDSPNLPPATVVPETKPPTTPERSTPATAVAPMTAPPAGTDVSPGWSRWIFNNVSRRWTDLRGRFAHDHDHETENENQPAVAAASEQAVSVAPTSPAEPVLVSPVTNVDIPPTVVSRPFVPPTATFEPTKTPAFSPVGKDQGMSPRVRGLPPSPPPRPVFPPPRPRHRTTSFVDTRTILAADDPTFDPDHETQREFVKRRHAARAAVLRKQAEERNREIMAAKRAAAQEAAAAEKVARLKLYAPSTPPKETSPRGSPIAANTGNRLTSPISGLIPMASHFQISPASRGKASQEAPIQTAAKSNVDSEKTNPRKRSRGFGLDEDDLAVHEEDFTPEEWEVLKAQVEKAEEDAAKAAQESAPPTKKRRVDQYPKQQKRTQRSVRRQATMPRPNQPPSRTTGFVPNRRGTFAPPDLSPIDSSQLLTDPESPSVSQTPPASTQPSETDEVPRSTPKNMSKSRRRTPSLAQAAQKGTMINGVYFPKHPLSSSDLSAEEVAERFPHRAFLPKSAATYYIRRERRWNPGRLFTIAKLFQPQEAEEVSKPSKTPNTPKKRVRWADLESPYSSGISQHWYAQRYDSAPTTPVSIMRRVREPSQTSWTFEDTSLAVSSPRLPTMPRPAIKRKRDAASASDLSSSPTRPVKRSRGYQAPDPYGSSSSPSSKSPQKSPYDAARYSSSPQPQRHMPQDGETCADIKYPHAATTEDFAVENDDPSPLSRARNKAELFKPKTPSRLRESTRIPSSNTSTPSALGYSPPSFLGALLDNSPYRSDPMSIDGSSYLPHPDATPAGTQAAITETVNTPTRTPSEDVTWLLQASPNGNFAALPWPGRPSLVEVLNLDSDAVPIAEQYWQEKGTDSVRFHEALFEA